MPACPVISDKSPRDTGLARKCSLIGSALLERMTQTKKKNKKVLDSLKEMRYNK